MKKKLKQVLHTLTTDDDPAIESQSQPVSNQEKLTTTLKLLIEQVDDLTHGQVKLAQGQVKLAESQMKIVRGQERLSRIIEKLSKQLDSFTKKDRHMATSMDDLVSRISDFAESMLQSYNQSVEHYRILDKRLAAIEPLPMDLDDECLN